MTIKFVIPFENRIRYHEGVILRAAIALKSLYGSNCAVMVVTGQEDYISVLQGHFNAQAPIVITPPESAKKYVTKDFTAVFATELHPEYSLYKELDCGLMILPSTMPLKLEHSSVAFGRTFAMPDVRPMLELFHGLKRVREPFVLR